MEPRRIHVQGRTSFLSVCDPPIQWRDEWATAFRAAIRRWPKNFSENPRFCRRTLEPGARTFRPTNSQLLDDRAQQLRSAEKQLTKLHSLSMQDLVAVRQAPSRVGCFLKIFEYF